MAAEICLQQIIPKDQHLTFLEVGVLRATNLVALAEVYPHIIFTGVDSYDVYYDYLHGYYVTKETSTLNKYLAEQNISKSRHRDRINLIIKDSSDYNKSVDDTSLDIVFLDKSLTEKEMIQDVLDWFPKVKYGGILCGHDAYTRGVMEGAFKGLRYFLRDDQLNDVKIIDEEVWYVVKTE